MAPFVLQVFGGSFEFVGQAAAIAGTLVLALMLVAMGAYAYKQLRGGGVEWPDDETDDEWDYY